MGLIFSFFAVVALGLIVFMGVKGADLHYLFGVIIPYAAFLCVSDRCYLPGHAMGHAYLFRSAYPTTGGTGEIFSLDQAETIDNPFTSLGVIIRMAFEVLLFRSLFRNTKAELREGPKLSYGSTKWLWMGGLAFHCTFLIILIRHLRLFLEPVPLPIAIVEALDGFFQVGAPVLYITDLIFLGAVTFLFLRRVIIPQVRYISLAADYFPLFLIGAIGAHGCFNALFLKDRCCGDKGINHGVDHLQSCNSPDYRHYLLYTSVPCFCLIRLFPHEQTDAYGRSIPQSYKESCEQ